MVIKNADEFRKAPRKSGSSRVPPRCPQKLSEPLCREIIDRFLDMKVWVAHNKTVPLEILRVLSVDVDARVRTAVAMKRKLDDKLFLLLARDPEETVRHAIAANAKCPTALLEAMIDDSSELVREAHHDA